MRMSQFFVAAGFGAALMFSGTSHAAVIVNYAFGANLSPDSTAANITGYAITGAGSLSRSGSTLSAQISDSSVGANQSAGKTASYFEVKVDVASGYKINLTDLTFNPGARFISSSYGFGVLSSIDAYAADVLSPTVTFTAASADTFGSLVTTNLSGASFQGLTGTQTFRIYTWENAARVANSFSRVDNVTLNGSVVLVPEPATVGLLAVGGLTMLARRRRTHARHVPETKAARTD